MTYITIGLIKLYQHQKADEPHIVHLYWTVLYSLAVLLFYLNSAWRDSPQRIWLYLDASPEHLHRMLLTIILYICIYMQQKYIWTKWIHLSFEVVDEISLWPKKEKKTMLRNSFVPNTEIILTKLCSMQ